MFFIQKMKLPPPLEPLPYNMKTATLDVDQLLFFWKQECSKEWKEISNIHVKTTNSDSLRALNHKIYQSLEKILQFVSIPSRDQLKIFLTILDDYQKSVREYRQITRMTY
jgi:hypothetical protein